MKKILYAFTVAAALSFQACTDDDITINNFDTEDGTLLSASALVAPTTTSFIIERTTDAVTGNEATEALALSWEAAETTTSEAIKYFVQMDLEGNSFNNATTLPLRTEGTDATSLTLSFGDLNTGLNHLNDILKAKASPLSVAFGDENAIQLRVQAVLGAAIAKTYSEPVSITVTPYFNGLVDNLVISSSAFSDVALAVNEGIYETRLELTANSTFKIFAEPVADAISYNYDFFTANEYTIASELEAGTDNDFTFTGADGNWDLVINTLERTITMTQAIIPDNLFMVGSHNGWNNADLSQQFNTTGDGVFTRVQRFDAGAEFKMIPTSGSWDGDWGEDPASAGSIIQDGESNISVADAGNYVVTVNFNTLTFDLRLISETLFMVGSHNGWNNADATQDFYTSGNGVFTRIQRFDAGAEFKMIPTSGSWDGDWGEDPANAGSIIQDGESNITITDAGIYKVTIDFETLTFTLTNGIPEDLFLVGSHNGWDNSTAGAFTKTQEGVFTITQTLTASDEFKFLPTLGSWDNDWGIDGDGMLIRDGESNVTSTGDGTFVITVDFRKGTVTQM